MNSLPSELEVYEPFAWYQEIDSILKGDRDFLINKYGKSYNYINMIVETSDYPSKSLQVFKTSLTEFLTKDIELKLYSLESIMHIIELVKFFDCLKSHNFISLLLEFQEEMHDVSSDEQKNIITKLIDIVGNIHLNPEHDPSPFDRKNFSTAINYFSGNGGKLAGLALYYKYKLFFDKISETDIHIDYHNLLKNEASLVSLLNRIIIKEVHLGKFNEVIRLIFLNDYEKLESIMALKCNGWASVFPPSIGIGNINFLVSLSPLDYNSFIKSNSKKYRNSSEVIKDLTIELVANLESN